MVFEAALFNDAEHIGDILNQEPGDIGEGIEVAGGRIAQGGAGHERQVIKGSVQAFTGAGVEFSEWGSAVDEQDGLGGGDWSERGEAVE